MHTHPTENRTPTQPALAEQFRQKGYTCEEIREDGTTVQIFRLDRGETPLRLPDLSQFPTTHLHSN